MSSVQDQKPIAIIGGGPAGLMAAEYLTGAQTGRRVIVFERKATPARKFLMAGRGGLNITHSEDLSRFLPRYGAAQAQVSRWIDGFTPQDMRDWCEGLGEPTFVGSSGRVFPRSMKASPLLRSWRARIEGMGAEIRTHHDWQGWDEAGDLVFLNAHGAKVTVSPAATLLALGGGSWARLGSDGGWVAPLAARGVDIAPLQPANCGFNVAWSPYLRDRFAGHPLKPVTLTVQGQSQRGEIMITQNGIEGGAVYALSAHAREACARDGQVVFHLDLRPDTPLEALRDRLAQGRGGLSFSNLLRRQAGLSGVAAALLQESGDDIKTFSPAQLAARIKNVPLAAQGTAPMDRAISTAGGIRLPALDDRMMIRALPGVFAAGEMLDWEAPTGGYLLQATFASARAAAAGLADYLSSADR